MKAICKILSVIILLLAVAGLIGSGVIAIGVWKLRVGLTQRVDRVAVPVREAIERTKGYLQTGDDLLQLAVVDTQDVKTTADGDVSDPARLAIVRKLARDKVLQKLAPRIDILAERLTALTGTIRVMNGEVRALNQLPFVDVEEKAEDEMGGFVRGLSKLTLAVLDLKAAVHDETPVNISLSGVQQHVGRVGSALIEIKSIAAEWTEWLDRLDERLDKVETELGRWFTIGAIVVSVAFVWLAIGQLSLVVHAWSWLRGRRNGE